LFFYLFSWLDIIETLKRAQFIRYLTKLRQKQDHQALLKAKYCPRVAAASSTQKTQQTHVILSLTFERDLEIQ